MGDLTAHFNKWEFACSCGECDSLSLMDPGFMATFERARVESGTSYTITSGYRCPMHPQTVSRPTSSHPKGLAADIHTPTSRKRYDVLSGLLQAGFTRLGIGPTFVHTDADSEKAQDVTWDYYKD